MSSRSPFALRLATLRRAATLTQKELAERSGLGLSTVCDYEAGRCEPTYGKIVALAAALGVKPGKLFDESN